MNATPAGNLCELVHAQGALGISAAAAAAASYEAPAPAEPAPRPKAPLQPSVLGNAGKSDKPVASPNSLLFLPGSKKQVPSCDQCLGTAKRAMSGAH